jgi:hypothetical protein
LKRANAPNSEIVRILVVGVVVCVSNGAQNTIRRSTANFPHDYVLKLEVVLPNGKVVKTGSNAYSSTSQIESYLRSAQNWAEGLIQ